MGKSDLSYPIAVYVADKYVGHPMAINLFTKTFQAESSQANPPEFLICERDSVRITAFLDELRSVGGAELAQRVNTVDNGKT